MLDTLQVIFRGNLCSHPQSKYISISHPKTTEKPNNHARKLTHAQTEAY